MILVLDVAILRLLVTPYEMILLKFWLKSIRAIMCALHVRLYDDDPLMIDLQIKKNVYGLLISLISTIWAHAENGLAYQKHSSK